jgi:hypothetical protein
MEAIALYFTIYILQYLSRGCCGMLFCVCALILNEGWNNHGASSYVSPQLIDWDKNEDIVCLSGDCRHFWNLKHALKFISRKA